MNLIGLFCIEQSYFTIISLSLNPGADFDASVARSRRSGSAGSGSVYSDTTSRSGTSSRRQKRYDTAPTFTAKLRPKKCLVSSSVLNSFPWIFIIINAIEKHFTFKLNHNFTKSNNLNC